MGMLDDVLAAIGGGQDAMQSALDRQRQINEFARSQGFGFGGGMAAALDPKFAEAYPELAAEYMDASPANGVGLSIGAGAMGAAARASANAAPAAPRPAQPMLPGLGSAAVPAPPRPQTPPPLTQQPGYVPGGNPNAPPPPVPQQGALPGFGVPGAIPTPNGPTFGPPVPPSGPRFGPWPFQAGLPGAHVGAANGPTFGPPIPPPGPGRVARAASGPLAIPAMIAASALPAIAGTAQRNGAAASAAGGPQGEYGRPGGPTEAEIAAANTQAAHDQQVEAERQRDHVIAREEREAQLAAAQALVAKAEAEKKQLEQAMAQSDMTESEKAQARRDLQELQDQRAGERGAANNASSERVAGMQIESANRNTDRREEGEDRRTTQRETGETGRTIYREESQNTRTRHTNDVVMRGQDIERDRDMDNLVTTLIARNLENGKLGVDKANKMIADWMSMAKLPAEILKQVSDSIQPFLPYMTNRSAGESAPGFEKGGAMEQMVKMGGGKYDPSKYKATSDFNLMDIAAQYGGGPPAAPIQPLDVQAVYANIPDVDMNPNSYRAQSAAATPMPRPQMGGGQQATPPMVESMMPQTMTPPMGEDAKQRIFNSLGR